GTLFGLLTLWAYARYARKRLRVESLGLRDAMPTPALDTRGSALDYCLALLFFAVGLMSKTMVVTLPCVMLLLDYWPLRRVAGLRSKVSSLKSKVSGPPTLNRLLLEKVPFFLMVAMVSVITYHAQKTGGMMIAMAGLSLGARVSNALVSYCRYLSK